MDRRLVRCLAPRHGHAGIHARADRALPFDGAMTVASSLTSHAPRGGVGDEAAYRCRFCGEGLRRSFCDLGMSPLSNAFVTRERLSHMEPFYPLHAYVCEKCLLVQLPEFETPDRIFSDYAYFSSYSESWLAHAKAYTEAMTARFGIGGSSRVIEIANNDGYLLQYFRDRVTPV